jgi:hypothetical protein
MMNFPTSFFYLCLPRLFAVLVLSATPFFLGACGDDDDNESEDARGLKLKEHKAPVDSLSKEIEAFTGDHTRVVWTQAQKKGGPDTFAISNSLVLMGIDSRNGLGIRQIIEEKGNYSRPLVTSDGKTILFTDKNTSRKSGKKHYKPMVYRTDWKGSKPVKLASGYATQSWKDPATGIEWVYAVRELRATTRLSLDGKRLVRFQLEDPKKEELIYDDTLITPDNIQFSRDGTRASALFPWPHAGMLIRQDDGTWEAKKLLNGCWTSGAPDNSGLTWVFDGLHKSVTMYAEDGAKSWPLAFNDAPGVKGREMYHPRWSNHPRFITLTGPYTKEKSVSGSVINKGGLTAEIYLGKLNSGADKMEGWLRLTDDDLGDSYPDVWVQGGSEASLADFPKSGSPPKTVQAKAAPQKGLLFRWQDSKSLNAFQDRQGHKLEALVNSNGAARFGRFNEMLLDGGTFEWEKDDAIGAVNHLSKGGAATLQAIVLPSPLPTSTEAPGYLFRSPGFAVQIQNGRLALVTPSGKSWSATPPVPAEPFHLMVVREGEGTQIYMNGTALPLEEGTVSPPSPVEGLLFGGNWEGGLLQITLHDHAIAAAEAAAHAEEALGRIAAFPPAPPRVKLLGKLVEVSAMPTAAGIDPYTSALITYVYDVEKVLEGEYTGPRVLVKHWAMLGLQPVVGFPREPGKSYELVLEPQSGHAHLQGERAMDDTDAFDLEPWFEVASPRVIEGAE